MKERKKKILASQYDIRRGAVPGLGGSTVKNRFRKWREPWNYNKPRYGLILCRTGE